jgi:hypothetical protein
MIELENLARISKNLFDGRKALCFHSEQAAADRLSFAA